MVGKGFVELVAELVGVVVGLIGVDCENFHPLNFGRLDELLKNLHQMPYLA
jgi:hypothetical protein